jgi:alpha-1,6-mannosyltransferase
MLREMAWFAIIGSAQEIIWIAAVSIGPLREHTIQFLLLIALSFVLCLWSCLRIPIGSRNSILLIFGFALLFRLTVLFAPPYQSEDVYRYIWDARVASLGVNPYEYPPNAPELEKDRDLQVYPMLNSKPYITAYPPLSQILFRISFKLFGPNVTAMKGVFSILEFLALVVAWRLLVLWRQSLQPLLLMAWHPFFVFEFSYSGHSESCMIFLILLSTYLLWRCRRGWAMVSYAGAVMAKLHPALWFPLFAKRAGWKACIAGASVGICLVLFYFDFTSLLQYLRSLSLYFKLFEFNASIHYLIRFLGRFIFHSSWDKVIGPYLGAVLLVITGLIVWKFPVPDALALLHAGFWIMVSDLCLATAVHPWYLSWAALVLPFFPYAFMLYWTGACFLSYIAYSYHPVYEPVWVLLIEYLPVYVLMAWEIRRGGPLLTSFFKKSQKFRDVSERVPVCDLEQRRGH